VVNELPPSLRDPALAPVWTTVSDRLDVRGPAWRGRVRLPGLSMEGRHLLASLLGSPARSLVDLADLEAALVSRGVGADLPGALDRLGHPLSVERAERRARRQAARDARAAAAAEVASWPEPWAAEWLGEVAAAGVLRGLDPVTAAGLIAGTRAVLDTAGSLVAAHGPIRSRSELAATVLGSAHALDPGTRAEAAATRALRRVHDVAADVPARQVWEAAGVPLDLVSAPALTWGLRPVGGGPAAVLARAATDAGVPVHLSVLALRGGPLPVPAGTVVLVAENPRVVEAAAQRALPVAVVAGNGNPSTAVRELVDLLVGAGARVLYHGDFDAAGLAIAGRMIGAGCEPFALGVGDYEAALAAADAAGVELPREEAAVPATPWCPALGASVGVHRRIVHEERVLDALLDEVMALVAQKEAPVG
jgi:uncharacterized protein (TIGR02679 family)